MNPIQPEADRGRPAVGFLVARIHIPPARPERRVLFIQEESGEELRLEVPAAALSDYDLSAGEFIEDTVRRELEALAEVEACRRKALRLLENRSRSEEELRRSLVRSDFSYLAIEEVIGDLAARGVVDDRAFAAEFAEQRRRLKGQAPSRVEMELRTRGVEREIAHRAAWGPYEEGEQEPEALQFDEAIVLLRRKLPRYHGLAREVARRRMVNLLSRAGYPTSLNLDAVDAVLDEMESHGLLAERSSGQMETGWE